MQAQITDLRSQVELKQNQKHCLMLERETLMDQVEIHHKEALHKDGIHYLFVCSFDRIFKWKCLCEHSSIYW